MALDSTYPQALANYLQAFIASIGTTLKVLVPPTPASGNLLGGQRVEDITIASSDTAARSVLLYDGLQLGFTGYTGGSITGQNTINVTGATWLAATNPPQVGDTLVGFGFTTAANNGVPLIVTAVASGAVTVNGTLLTNETMPGTAPTFYRIAQRTRIPVPINSGNVDATPNVAGFGSGQPEEKSVDQLGIDLGPTGAILVGLVAAVSALPAQVMVRASARLY